MNLHSFVASEEIRVDACRAISVAIARIVASPEKVWSPESLKITAEALGAAMAAGHEAFMSGPLRSKPEEPCEVQ